MRREDDIYNWKRQIELQITKKQAQKGYHAGQCGKDIEDLRRERKIANQLKMIEPRILREELRHWGAWNEEELANHEHNLDRILWLACADIVETYC